MNKKITLFVVAFIICIACLNGQTQTISYSYDANGNRTGRILNVQQQRSLEIPGGDTLLLPPVEPDYDKMATDIVLVEGELNTTVYPNPTKGLLKIEISNMPLNAKTEARLYNLSGNQVMIRKDFGNNYDMDLSNMKDGTYILRIRISNRIFDWKVIKNNR
jgi:YD repeat-containing protein